MKHLLAIALLISLAIPATASDAVSVDDEIARLTQQLKVITARIDYLTALKAAGVTTTTTQPPPPQANQATAILNADGTAVINGQLFVPAASFGAGACSTGGSADLGSSGRRHPIRNFLKGLFGGGGIFGGARALACQ